MLWGSNRPVAPLARDPFLIPLGKGSRESGKPKGDPMSETPPENTGPTLEDFARTMREATKEGMKDYDRERDEWESAVAEQERQRKESENDSPPVRKGGGIGAWILGGSGASKASS